MSQVKEIIPTATGDITEAGGATSIRYQYDANGNLAEKVNPAGQVERHVYDANNRLTASSYFANATASEVQAQVNYSYDKAGKPTNISKLNHNGSALIHVNAIEYSYDDNGQIIEQITTYYDPNGSELFSKSISYTYHLNNQVATYTDVTGNTISYDYNANNQLQTVMIPNEGTISYSGYNWMAVSNINYPGGVSRQLSYDPFMRTKQIKVTHDNNSLMDYQYGYDKASNIISKTTTW